ncbi:MAG: TlpA disulfide reductase family protein [Candidatus Pedobacter colombiensis]|uniref:TlpA disulfide reductase family protein n=1 Tax=Candidatus Pedobacter colombiensis TaxID=3121371 RepID=A0AAJ5W8I2_9SPHI|nr:TlpA disulfide reductase family protein [Pedobacter sp.]WEK20031.1 MAG: TlpA disulfide reductase family protein [Pedobacter sp.]
MKINTNLYMHHYKKFLLLIAIVFMISSLKAQSYSFNIKGKLDSTIVNYFNNKSIQIKLYDPAKNLLGGEVITVLLDSKRRFNINVKSASALTYASFELVNEGNNKNALGVSLPLTFPARLHDAKEYYLFENGDDITVDVGEQGYLLFSGKGAEKLNCQFDIYNIEGGSKGIVKRWGKLINAKDYDKAFKLNAEEVSLMIKLRLKLLESYKGEFSESIYNRIYLDAIGNARLWGLSEKSGLVLYARNEAALSALRNLNKMRADQELELTVDSNFIPHSAYYPAYIFEKEWNIQRLRAKEAVTGDSFVVMYDVLQQKYHGALRDQLLMICISKLNRYFSAEIQSSLGLVMKSITDPAYKKTLIAWQKKQNEVFPFELQDTAGNIRKLSDYKGKLVIVDFWFTGCGYCEILNKTMETIIKKYENNKNIVFLTISSDSDKKRWLTSVSTGLYTSPGTINLYTNGLGLGHPIIKHYGFYSAPQQLIIDKDGMLITAHPLRPDMSLEAMKNFTQIIDKYLSKVPR